MFRFTLSILIALTIAVPVIAQESRFLPLGAERHDIQSQAGLRMLQQAARDALATNPPPKTRRGLSALQALAAKAESAPNARDRAALLRDLAEVAAALENNKRSPVPRSIDLFQLPFVHYRYISGRVGVGTIPASDLRAHPAGPHSSEIDPVASSFWARPRDIPSQNLRPGFGRNEVPQYEAVTWQYAGPKTSYGGNAGFEARNDHTKIKIKFGEIHSEPFAARIFHALGYNVQPTDYSPGLKIKYDRRLITEFNSRKPVDTKITALGVLPVWTIRFQPRHDPAAFIAHAVLKDGREISGTHLRERLTADDDAEFDYVVTTPANVQVESREEKSIGPWDFGQLGHENLRALRGAGLLAAWLGWFDSRFDNTRLVVKNESAPVIKHVFADLGGGLGRSTGWSGWRGELPDDFPDRFTRPEIRQGRGRMTIPFRIVNFRPIEATPAFGEMTMDDARWMARLMAQLTEPQIVDALRASGFNEPAVEIYRRKLLSRREHLMRDLAGTLDASP
jgi:hypothetical protein